jgi:hypothetical protein
VNDPVTNHRTNRALFVWLAVAGPLGSLIGMPWTIAAIVAHFVVDLVPYVRPRLLAVIA